MSRIVLAMFMMLALAGSASSFAQVTMIDQNVVRDEGGFPFKIKKPGSYKLTGNLTVPRNTDGIVVMADHVTINLNGFSILGPVACTTNDMTGAAVCPTGGQGIGIKSGDTTGATPGTLDLKISNGSVHGMGSFGIFATGEGAVMEEVSADGNAGGGFIVAGSVLMSSATGNGGVGVLALVIRESRVTGNTTDGIDVDGAGGVAIGNTSSFNGRAGMNLPNGVANNNTIVRNNGVGIVAKCPAVVTGNVIVNNVGGTLTMDGGDCAVVNNATLPQI